jgi:hypothetical protein
MAGLMGITAFLSMWINNSASANIMIPTAIAIVNELQNYHETMKQTAVSNENDNHESSTDNVSINSTSELYLYLNIWIANQHYFCLQLRSQKSHIQMNKLWSFYQYSRIWWLLRLIRRMSEFLSYHKSMYLNDQLFGI